MTKQQLASAFYRQGVDAMERSDWAHAGDLCQPPSAKEKRFKQVRAEQE